MCLRPSQWSNECITWCAVRPDDEDRGGARSSPETHLGPGTKNAQVLRPDARWILRSKETSGQQEGGHFAGCGHCTLTFHINVYCDHNDNDNNYCILLVAVWLYPCCCKTLWATWVRRYTCFRYYYYCVCVRVLDSTCLLHLYTLYCKCKSLYSAMSSGEKGSSRKILLYFYFLLLLLLLLLLF